MRTYTFTLSSFVDFLLFLVVEFDDAVEAFAICFFMFFDHAFFLVFGKIFRFEFGVFSSVITLLAILVCLLLFAIILCNIVLYFCSRYITFGIIY